MAAVLACGDDAWISHGSAAYLHHLWPYAAKSRPVQVTVLRRSVERPGIRVHRVRGLHADEVTRIEGIPVTSLARTVVDLAAVLGAGDLERLIAEAYTRDLGEAQLRRLLARYPARPGTPALRALLDRECGPKVTDSEAERQLLQLVRAAGLPEPRTGVWLHGHKVDFLWPAQRLIVEVDGYRFHSSRARFQADRRRDQDLTARGFVVIRVAWSHLVDEPHALVARLSAALARADERRTG
jgi:very-short-patch-repair endonuclease